MSDEYDSEEFWSNIAPCPNCGKRSNEMTDIDGSALCTNINCSVEMYDPNRSADSKSQK